MSLECDALCIVISFILYLIFSKFLACLVQELPGVGHIEKWQDISCTSIDSNKDSTTDSCFTFREYDWNSFLNRLANCSYVIPFTFNASICNIILASTIICNQLFVKKTSFVWCKRAYISYQQIMNVHTLYRRCVLIKNINGWESSNTKHVLYPNRSLFTLMLEFWLM